MARAFIFGLGYTGVRVAERLRACGWDVAGTGGGSALKFDDTVAVSVALGPATHVVSTIPPGSGLLDSYGPLLHDKWLGYLSSTGVYGDAGGAWVDESALLNGRRGGRIDEDAAWLARDARVFRLPGIYGPGRSALERVLSGAAHRVDVPGQVFSRVHVDDIVAGVRAGFDAPSGAYNLSDDRPCDQNTVMEAAARLLGVPPPAVRTARHAVTTSTRLLCREPPRREWQGQAHPRLDACLSRFRLRPARVSSRSRHASRLGR